MFITAFWIVYPIFLSGMGFVTYKHPTPMKSVLGILSLFAILSFMYLSSLNNKVEITYEKAVNEVNNFRYIDEGLFTDTTRTLTEKTAEMRAGYNFSDQLSGTLKSDEQEDTQWWYNIKKYLFIIISTVVLFYALCYLFEYIQNPHGKKSNNSPDSTSD